MLRKSSWKTVMVCVLAIALGAALGPAIGRVVGGLGAAGQAPAVVQAAAPAGLADDPTLSDVYTCTPSFIGAFQNRVHVLCTLPAAGTIYYFATPTSNSNNANRVLSIMLTAKALGKNLQIYYTAAGDGSAFGCQTSNCRPIDAIEIMQ